MKDVLSLLAPLGISVFLAGHCQKNKVVRALIKPFLHIFLGIVIFKKNCFILLIVILLQFSGTISFWLLGSGFVSGGNVFIGTENFLFINGLDSSTFYLVNISFLGA